MDNRVDEIFDKNKKNERRQPKETLTEVTRRFERISEERQLLEEFIKISESYLEKDDLPGLKKWIVNMKSFLIDNK